MDQPAFVSYASSNPTYAVMETSGTVNLCKNIMHLFFLIERSLYMNERITL